MNKEMVDKIYKKIYDEWVRRHSAENLNPETLEAVRKMLELVPDDDGCKRVASLATGKVHLVPVEEIILNGIRGDDLDRFPVELEVGKK